MLRARVFLFGPLTAIAIVAATAPARAAAFYQGKTVTILVGSTPGGGFDAYARLLALRLGEHIPGHPDVIVQNMPGAGSLTAARALAVTQPRDGTVIATFNPGLVTQSIVQPKRVGLDFNELTWVGVATPDFRVCYGYGPKGVRSWADLMQRKQFIIGSTAKGAGNYINGATLRIVLHAPVKQILGFPGAAEQRLAIEQGELDGDCGAFTAIPSDWVQTGKIHMFLRFSKTRLSEIPESAVYIEDLAKTVEEKRLLDVLDAGDELGRPFAMSKWVPEDRIAIMRKAFDQTMKDPAFLAEAKKEQLPIIPLTGQETEEAVDKMIDAPPAIVAQAREIYQ